MVKNNIENTATNQPQGASSSVQRKALSQLANLQGQATNSTQTSTAVNAYSLPGSNPTNLQNSVNNFSNFALGSNAFGANSKYALKAQMDQQYFAVIAQGINQIAGAISDIFGSLAKA